MAGIEDTRPLPDYLANVNLSGGGSASSGTEGLSGFGWFATLSGAMLAAVGSYYSAKSQQYQLKSQALNAEFGASMASLNARAAEDDAIAAMEAGKQEKAALTLQQGQERAALQVQQAVSGTAAGSGSNAEVLASQRLSQRIESMTMDSNTLREVNASKIRAVNYRNEADLGRVSAENIRSSARSINPYLAAGSSLLSSSGTLADRWLYRESTSQRRRY